MAAIGLAEAARMTGRNASTIHRAMRSGRLSYTKDAAGERRVEISELERVFGVKIDNMSNSNRGNGATAAIDANASYGNDTHGGELAALQRLLDERECTIGDRARLDGGNPSTTR
jgi:hypothetical protein